MHLKELFMTEIYLIRHAQAEGNIYRFMQGHWDGDVTETGQLQIKALAEKLKDIKIDAVRRHLSITRRSG